MSDDNDDIIEAPQDVVEENGPDNFFIDILTGNKESASAKKLLVQKVLRQLIESYGFDRNDLEVNYNPQIPGQGRKRIDIAIFRPDVEHNNDNLQRIIVCKNQKKRDKLRSIAEADTDLRELKELLELIPGATLGMWTNGQEEFLFQVERTRFEAEQVEHDYALLRQQHAPKLPVIDVGVDADWSRSARIVGSSERTDRDLAEEFDQ